MKEATNEFTALVAWDAMVRAVLEVYGPDVCAQMLGPIAEHAINVAENHGQIRRVPEDPNVRHYVEAMNPLEGEKK